MFDPRCWFPRRTEPFRRIRGCGRQISTGSCDGVFVIWLNGSVKSFASLWVNRHSAGRCMPWVTARWLPDRNIMSKTLEPLRSLKNFPAAVAEIASGAALGKRIEIWYQDEARIGQKNKITRHYAKRCSRPCAPHNQRTRSAYIFGVIYPKLGKVAALIMPWSDTYAMAQHLAEIDLPRVIPPEWIRVRPIEDGRMKKQRFTE